jgi:hypothetical protein
MVEALDSESRVLGSIPGHFHMRPWVRHFIYITALQPEVNGYQVGECYVIVIILEHLISIQLSNTP